MSLKIHQNGVTLRIVLLEVDGANETETLRYAALSLNDTWDWMRKIREAPAWSGEDSSAELSQAIARRSSAFLFSFVRKRVVMSARSGRRSIPPMRSAQIGSTWVMLKRRGCMRPRMFISGGGSVTRRRRWVRRVWYDLWPRRCERHSFRAHGRRCSLVPSDLFHASI